MYSIILFDGDCNFCDKSVQFIIKRDGKGHFKFASLQSDIGKELIKQYQIPNELDSLILISNHSWYAESSAALRICRQLNHVWKLGYFCLIIPKKVRDFCYRFIAKHRYRLFGKKVTCTLPSPEFRKRFL